MTGTALLAAHGSRDPAAQRSVAALAGQVAALAPELDVRVGFVEHAKPGLRAALAAAGPGTVIVPLLLSAGYHLNVDITCAARAAGARVAAALGPDPLLTEALADRLADRLASAGAPAPAVTVLAAAGSADPRAIADVQRQARLLARRIDAPVLPAYASAAQPSVAAAVTALRAPAAQPVAVATYLLSPGYFYDQLRRDCADQASDCWVSAPLGTHPSVAALILDRFAAVAAA